MSEVERRAPRVCFLGPPHMGSVRIRGQQIASARPEWTYGGEHLLPEHVLAHELFVFVKRVQPRAMRLLRRLGKRVVYDVLDSWRQPADDLLVRDRDAAVRLFSSWLPQLPLDGVIFPNAAMREDLGDLVPAPRTIYHHHRPGLEPIRVRERAEVVAYEGEARYLGEWRGAVERACAELGLRFVVNPASWYGVDVAFAARGGAHASYLSRRYKSNVKLANVYGAAVPCVFAPEASYRETGCAQVRTCERPEDLKDALRDLLPRAKREAAHAAFREERARFSLEVIAAEYEAYFTELLGDPLARRRVRQEVLAETDRDIDAFIMGDEPDARRWECFELTQAQDVRGWIADPTRIKALQPHLRALAADLREDAGLRSLLDVGCYGGYVLDYLRGPGGAWGAERTYLGVDVQPRAVEAAARAHGHVAGARFEPGDVFALAEQEADAYDVVWCARVLIHLPRFEDALRGLLHVARRRLYVVLALGEDRCRRIRETDCQTGEQTVYYYRTISEERLAAAASGVPYEVAAREDGYSLVVFDASSQAAR